MEWVSYLILGLVAAQRIGELFLDRSNTAALLLQGGEEHGEEHYKFFIILHSAWLMSLLVWVALINAEPNWILLCLYLVLQAGRLWVLRTLGPYWTTRIITVPTAPLITSGPYRFARHPNYLVVVCEIALLPLIFGGWQIALVFSILNAALLRVRIHAEDTVLASRKR